MSEKDKRPPFSFSNKKFMLGRLENNYFLNFSMMERRKPQKCCQHSVYRRQASNHEGNL